MNKDESMDKIIMGDVRSAVDNQYLHHKARQQDLPPGDLGK